MAQLRAVDYLRVSTEDQIKGYGITAASRKTLAYIERKGWEHVKTFADEGFSGSLEAHERPDLKRLMALARSADRPFDMVVVSEGRAIGRTGRAFWRWVWELEDLGVFVAVVRGDYDNSTPAGRSRMRADADKAEEEREIIRDRTQGGIQEKAEDGRHPGGQARYGYRIEDQGKVGLSRQAPDECDGGAWCTRTDPCESLHEAAVLRRGRSLVVQHRGNWSKAVLHLNAEGMVSRSGKPWSVPNFRARLLGSLDPTYVFRGRDAILDGDGRPVWGESVTIRLEPIFTDDEVAELRRATGPRAQTRPDASRVYTLTGRIRSLCGAHYVGSTSTTRGTAAHYQCAGKQAAHPGGPVCDCPQLDAAGVEEWAWHGVRDILANPAKIEELARREMARSGEQRVDHAARLAELDQLVAEQMDAIDTAMAMGAKSAARRGLRGREAEEAVGRMTRPLEQELEALETQRREVAAWQADADQMARRATDLQALAEMASEGLADISKEDQRQLLALLEVTACITAPVPPMRKGPPCSLAEWFREQDRLVPVLTEESWSSIAPLLKRGLEDRRVLEALLRKAGSGERWAELEREFGTTALRTHWRRWKASGLWENVMAALPREGQPVPRRHPLPSMRLHGVLQPGLILAASEDRDRASGPSVRYDSAAYRFSMASAA